MVLPPVFPALGYLSHPMRIYKDKFPVVYGQFYFFSDTDWDGNLEACFSSQTNGLCGVSFPGIVFFITGLHTGNISLDVNLFESEPPLNELADEIVEASIEVVDPNIALESWGEEKKVELGLTPGTYRLRYRALDFGKAEDLGLYDEGDIEFYCVDIWSAPFSGDQIIKVQSEQAKYWHNEIIQHQK